MFSSIFIDFFQSLPAISLVLCVLCLLASALFKQFDIFKISLLILLTKGIFVFCAPYQALLASSTILPFIFTLLLSLKKNYHTIKCFLSDFCLLFGYFAAVFLLANSSNAAALLGSKFLPFSIGVSDVFFCVFLLNLLYLIYMFFLQPFKKIFFLAYFLLQIDFLFYASTFESKFFEFASILFLIYIGQLGYEMAFYEHFSKLKNQRYFNKIRMNEKDVLALISIDKDFQNNIELKNIFLSKIAKEFTAASSKSFCLEANKFAIILSDEDFKICVTKLDNIRKIIENTDVKYENLVFNTTISVGLASYEKNKMHTFQMASERLDEAIKNGRNRVIYGL